MSNRIDKLRDYLTTNSVKKAIGQNKITLNDISPIYNPKTKQINTTEQRDKSTTTHSLNEVSKNEPTSDNDEEVELSNNKQIPLLTLQVKLNDFSPVYETPFGERYREKLDPNIFSQQGDLNQQKINSYVDHDVSIEKLIASTTDKSMIIEQSDTLINANIRYNENDPLLKKVFDLTERGVITSNSFIYKAFDIEFKEYEDTDVIDVIYTRGELISIDPVYAGFYPQNETSVSKSEKIEQKPNEINEKETQMVDKIEIIDTISPDSNETIVKSEDGIEKEPVEPTSQPVEDKEPETTEEVEENKENEVESTEEVEKTEETPVEEQKEPTTEEKTLKTQENQGDNQEKMDKLNKMNDLFAKSIDNPKTVSYEDARAKVFNREALTDLERKALVNEFNSLSKAEKQSISVAVNGSKDNVDFIMKSIDGTTEGNGLFLAESLVSPKFIAENAVTFPELTTATVAGPLEGLSHVELPILLANPAIASALAEGADATELENALNACLFTPVRYQQFFRQNKQVNNGQNLIAKQTQSLRDAAIRAIRSKLFTNMLAKVETELEATGYDGGARKESLIGVTGSELTFEHLDAVIRKITGIYGDAIASKYAIYMHSDTLGALEKAFVANTHNTLIANFYNPTNKSYRGFQIIADPFYTGKNAANSYPATFVMKENIAIYGGSFSYMDDNISFSDKNQFKRSLLVYGEVKLADPQIATRVIKLGTVTKAVAK